MAQETLFAPAERVTEQEIETQYREFFPMPLLRQLLIATPDIFLILESGNRLIDTLAPAQQGK
ncbi:MAG: hypothetical protein WCK47_13845 [bacterium]|nr:hypothetical protein [Candidatus Sumerlaeota bacterium]